MRFAEVLRALRLRHDLTQVQLATKLDISQSHLAHLEMPQRSYDTPSLELVLLVARLFGVSTDFLLRSSWPIDEVPTSVLNDVTEPIAVPQNTGAKIRRLREAIRMLQRDVAAELGLPSAATLSNIEASRRRPSLDLLVRIADEFDVTIDWLLDDARSITDAW